MGLFLHNARIADHSSCWTKWGAHPRITALFVAGDTAHSRDKQQNIHMVKRTSALTEGIGHWRK